MMTQQYGGGEFDLGLGDGDQEQDAGDGEASGGGQESVPALKSLTGPFLSLGEIQSLPLRWVWDGWIPRGKLTLVVGEPGVGKSLFALYLAAMVSRGRRLPGRRAADCASGERVVESDQNEVQREGQNEGDGEGRGDDAAQMVLVFSGEDDYDDTVKPRLEAANADLTRIFRLSAEFKSIRRVPYTRMLMTGKDFESIRYFDQLEACLSAFHDQGIDAPLVIVDPVELFMNCDDRNSDLPEKVIRLSQIASHWDAAIVALADSKGASYGVGRTAYRNATAGNAELARAARSVILIAQDPQRAKDRLVLPIKLNLGETQPAMKFTIRNRAVVADADPTSITSELYFTLARQDRQGAKAREELSELQRVMNWLQQRLSQGEVRVSVISSEAPEHAISEMTLRRAFRCLGCSADKAEGQAYWVWRLPKTDPPQETPPTTAAEPSGKVRKTKSASRSKSK